jgi:phage shock protein PspC (stress-responsive transcriptional regulator)
MVVSHRGAKNQSMNEQGNSGQQTGMDRFFSTLRGIGLRRRTDEKWIAGVCSGLADRLGVDPVIVRAGFVLLTLLGGAGITIYLVIWALLPNDREEIVAQRALRDADGGSIVVIILAALALFGGSAFDGPWWSGHSGWGFPWGVFFTGLLIWWLVKRSGSGHDADERVRAQQGGSPTTGSPMAGPSPAAGGASSPQTQVLPQGPGFPQTQVLPQGQGSPQTQALPQGPNRMQWEGTPGFPQGQGLPQGTLPPRGPVPPRAPAVTKLRRRSGGLLMAMLTLGLALATYGSLLWAGNTYAWTGDHTAIALAGSLAATGLLMVGLGVAGWRTGFAAFVAVVLAVSAWTSSVIPSGIHVNGRIGDAVWTPTSVAAANGHNYQLGIGNGVLDLSSLAGQSAGTTLVPAPVATPTTIPAYVGVGELKVIVVGHVSLGEILLPGDRGGSGQGGSDVSRTVVVGVGPTEVVVNAGVGIGQLTVVKE